MQISGDYGTELLLRYSEEELQRTLERRRVAEERSQPPRGEAEPARRPITSRRGPGSVRARIARFFLREDTAAGGPEWVRPERNATTADAVASPATATAELPDAEISPVGQSEDERMPSPALVGSRQ